jgi:hypothetical protein
VDHDFSAAIVAEDLAGTIYGIALAIGVIAAAARSGADDVPTAIRVRHYVSFIARHGCSFLDRLDCWTSTVGMASVGSPAFWTSYSATRRRKSAENAD